MTATQASSADIQVWIDANLGVLNRSALCAASAQGSAEQMQSYQEFAWAYPGYESQFPNNDPSDLFVAANELRFS